ncbi:valine-pyruvate aminotransferase [Moraxella catarrhalis BC1]|nr:valine-pyruvate aminotransferase [Moraxella catarrhalis BC1]
MWFEGLPISTTKLYQILKQQGTLIIPSEHFFCGNADGGLSTRQRVYPLVDCPRRSHA